MGVHCVICVCFECIAKNEKLLLPYLVLAWIWAQTIPELVLISVYIFLDK